MSAVKKIKLICWVSPFVNSTAKSVFSSDSGSLVGNCMSTRTKELNDLIHSELCFSE